MKVKVLVIPVYRRHWLYHTWIEGGGVDASLLAAPWYQVGHTAQDKWTALTAQANHKMNNFVAEQWKLNAAAKDGSFRSWLHKLALAVLAREDPIESFVKKLPRAGSVPAGQTMVLEVLYPPSLDPVLVRRRLRHIALRTTNTQRRALVGWTLATLPQSPLILTPFPNVTLYYTAYKMVSSYRALGGAATLQAAAENSASHALQRVLDEAEGGGQQHHSGGGPLGWGRRKVHRRNGHAGHVSPEQRLEAILQRLGVETSPQEDSLPEQQHQQEQLTSAESFFRRQLLQQQQQGKSKQRPPLIAYLPSNQLEDITQPLDRWRTPLEDSVLGALAVHAPQWSLDGLEEHLQRVRRRAIAEEAKRDADRGRHAPPTPPPPYAIPSYSAVSAGSTTVASGFGNQNHSAGGTLPGLPHTRTSPAQVQNVSAPYSTSTRGLATGGLLADIRAPPKPRMVMAVASILPLTSSHLSQSTVWGKPRTAAAAGVVVPASLACSTTSDVMSGSVRKGFPAWLWGSSGSSPCMVRAAKQPCRGKAHGLVVASLTAAMTALRKLGRR